MESSAVALQHCVTTGKSPASLCFPSKMYLFCLPRLDPIPPTVSVLHLAPSLSKTGYASH